MTGLKNLRQFAICSLLACGFGLSAHAQEVKPNTVPSDPNADSIAAMKFTVHDPRIGKALAEHEGIWKGVVPPVKMAGGFDDHDPIGLVAHTLIPVDCSINWTDPDTHKLYCFTTATSLVFFLASPQNYLAEAQRNWRLLTGKPST